MRPRAFPFYVPPNDAVCDFPRCDCDYMCNVAIPRAQPRLIRAEVVAVFGIAAVMIALVAWLVMR